MGAASLSPLNPKITCQTLEETLGKIEATPSLLDRGLTYEVCLRVFGQIKTNAEIQDKLPPLTAKIEAIPKRLWFSYGIYTIYRTVVNFFSRLLPNVFHHLDKENEAYNKFVQEIATKATVAHKGEILSKSAEQEAGFLAERCAVELEAALEDFDLNAEERRLYNSLLETSLRERAALTTKLLSDIEALAKKELQATTKEEDEAFADLLTSFHTMRMEIEEEEARKRLLEEAEEITPLLQTQAEELLLLYYTEKARAADEAQDYSTAFSLWQEVLSRQKIDSEELSYKKVLFYWIQAHVLSGQADPVLTREHLTYLLALGKHHLEQQALDNAAKFFAKVLEIVPGDPKALRLATEIRAQSLISASNFQEAYPLFLELDQKERALEVVETWRDSYCPHPLPLEATLSIAQAYLELDKADKADLLLRRELKGKAGIPKEQSEPLLSLYKKRLDALQAPRGRQKAEKHQLIEIIYRLEGGADNCNKLFQSCLDEARDILSLETETSIPLRDVFAEAAKLALTLKARPEQARDLGLLCIKGGLPEKAIEALSIKKQTESGPRYLYEKELKEALDAALKKVGYPPSERAEGLQGVSSPTKLSGEGSPRCEEVSKADVLREALFEYASLYSELHEPEETWLYLKEMEHQGLKMSVEADHSLFMSCLEKALDKCSPTKKLELLQKFNSEWPLEELRKLIITTYDLLIKGYDKRIDEGASLPTSEKLQLQEARYRYFLQRDKVSSSALTKQGLGNAHGALALSYRLAAEQETNLDQKMRYLSRVLELKPEDINSKQALVYAPIEAANAAEKAQKWNEAVQHTLRALELNKRLNAVDPLLLYKRLGVYHYHLNDHAQALTFFSKTTANGDKSDESRIRHILAGDQAYKKALADFTPRLKQQITQFVKDIRSETFWKEIEGTLGYRLGSWSSENREFAYLGYYNKNYEETKKEAARAVELMVKAYDSRHLKKSIPNDVVQRIKLLQGYLNEVGSKNTDLSQALQEYKQAHQSNPHLYEPYLHNLFETYSILGDATAMNALRQRFPNKFG